MMLICVEMPVLKGSVLAFYKYNAQADPISPYVLYMQTLFLNEQPYANEDIPFKNIEELVYAFGFLIFLSSNQV